MAPGRVSRRGEQAEQVREDGVRTKTGDRLRHLLDKLGEPGGRADGQDRGRDAMGYEVRGVIAAAALAEIIADGFGPGTRAVGLEQGFALVPYTGRAHDHFLGRHGERLHPFTRLGSTVAALLAKASHGGPVAYVEADYFGGAGEQHAAVWDSGALAWGPMSVGFGQTIPPQGTAISRALRRLGVVSGDTSQDEFDAVGLQRHRHLEDWLPEMADDEETADDE